jgi:hypothetical protein
MISFKSSAIVISAILIFELLNVCYCPRGWLDSRLGSVQGKEHVRKSSDENKATKPDGSFNGFDIFYVDSPPVTTVHCVGENFDDNRSWLFRSCEYKTLCFDIDRRDIVTYQDTPISMPNGWWSSTQTDGNDTHVAGGSQPKTWFPVVAEKIQGLKTKIGQFRPRAGNAPKSYYRFNATMLPFYRHPTSYRNPGHLQWDDFMPLYTLLDIFDRVDDLLYLAQMRRPTTDEFEEPIPPFDIISRFLPLMGNHRYNIDINQGYDLQLGGPKFSRDGGDRVICADYGLTGSGLFSDHGEHRWHGQWPSDRVLPHNIGRGGLFRRYRRFLMNNLGISPDRQLERHPYKIIVSLSSSTKRDRANVTFDGQIETLYALGDRVDIQAVNMANLTLYEQIELTSTAAVYVSVVGGGVSTAMFLPKGAHLILFYSRGRYLDWDFWNNFPHIKVHWVPLLRDEGGNIVGVKNRKLLKLVATELDFLDAHPV